MAQDFTLTAQLRLQGPQNINQVLNQIRNQFGNIPLNVVVRADGLASAQKQLGGIQNAADGASKSITTFGTQAALAAKRFFAFSLATSGFLKLIGAIQSGVKDAIEFEREVFKISQVTGTAVRDLQDLTKEVTRLSTGLGVSSKELLNVAQVLAQAGLTAEDTKISLEALAKSGLSPTFDSIAETGEGVIAIMAQFGVKASGLEDKLSSLNSVAGKFAVESSDLITAVRRTGGAFQAAGGSLEELISLFTSVRSTTRESAESIATGFRTIFTRLQRIRTVNFLSNIGVELRDLEGQFVGPYEAIRRLSEALKDIPSTDPRFAQVIEELGGFRQISKVIPLIQKFSESQKALIVAQQGQGSLAKDADSAQESLANKLTKTREEFEALIRRLTQNDSFKALIDLTTKLASSLIKVADAATPLLPLIAALGAAKIARGFSGFTSGFKGGLGFNSGGLVPGSGNRDTVPANLTPGEFVLRKSAVNAIGIDRLHGLNKGGSVRKYAKGGTVEELYEDENDVRQFKDYLFINGGRKPTNTDKPKILAKMREFIDSSGSHYSDADLGKLLLTGNLEKFRAARSTESANLIAKKEKSALRSATAFNPGKFLPPESERQFGAIYLNPLDIKNKRQSNVRLKSNVQGSEGIDIDVPIDYFQASMTSEAAAGFTQRVQKKLPYLIAGLAGDIAPSFGASTVPNKIKNIPGEKSISGFLFEGALMSLGAPYTGDELDDGRNFDFKTGLGSLGSIFPPDFPKNRPIDAKLTQSTSNDSSLNKKAKTHLVQQFPHLFQPFAKGGQANGTDTVPAVLTPGEFVFTKKAAERIGYGNLNRMNKVQGYAKGGTVQHFATGSSGRGVTVNGSSAQQGGGIFNSVEAKAFILATSFQTLNSYVGKSNKEFGDLLNAIGSAVTQFTIFSSVFKQSSEFGKSRREKISTGRINNRLQPDAENIDIQKTQLDRLSTEKQAQQNDLKTRTKTLLDRRLNSRDRTFANEFVRATPEERTRIEKQIRNQVVRNDLRKEAKERIKNSPVLSAQFDSARSPTAKANIVQAVERRLGGGRLVNAGRQEREAQAEIKRSEENLVKKRRRFELAEQKKLDRRESLDQRNGLIASVGGAAFGIAGQRFLETSQNNITNGNFNNAERNSGIGGGLIGAGTGAAAGAALGSVVPLLGTAAGGLIGAVLGFGIGFYNSANDAKKQIESVKFEKEFKSLTTKLQQDGGLSNVQNFSKAASNRLFSTKGDDFKSSFGALEGQALNVEQALTKVAQSYVPFDKNIKNVNSSLDQFLSDVGPETIALFSRITNTSLVDVEKKFKNIIESATRLAKFQEKAGKATNQFSNEINKVFNVSRAFNDALFRATESLEKANSALEPLSVQASNREANAIGNPQNFLDPKIFAQSLNNTLKPILSRVTNPQDAQSTVNRLNNGFELIRSLPDILSRSRTIGTSDDPADTILGNIEKALGPAISKQFESSIRNSLTGLLGSEGKPENLVNKLEQDFQSVVDTLSGAIEKSTGFKELSESASKFIDILNQEISLRDKIRGAELNRLSVLARNIDLTDQYNDILRKVDDKSVRGNFGFQERSDRQRLLLGTQRDIGPAELARDLFANFQNIQSEIAKGPSLDPTALSGFQTRVTKSTQALEELANVSKQLEPNLRKLDDVTKKRQQAETFADQLAGGGKGARQSISGVAQVLQIVSQSRQGGRLQGPLNPETATQVLGTINQFKSILDEAGIKTDLITEDIRKNAITSFAPLLQQLFPDPKDQATADKVLEGFLKNIGVSEQDKVLAEIKNVVTNGTEANKYLAQLQQTQIQLAKIQANSVSAGATAQAAASIKRGDLETKKRDQQLNNVSLNNTKDQISNLSAASKLANVSPDLLLKNRNQLETARKAALATRTESNLNLVDTISPTGNATAAASPLIAKLTQNKVGSVGSIISEVAKLGSDDAEVQKILQSKLQEASGGKGFLKQDGTIDIKRTTEELTSSLFTIIQNLRSELNKDIEAGKTTGLDNDSVLKNFDKLSELLKNVGDTTVYQLGQQKLKLEEKQKQLNDEIQSLDTEVVKLEQVIVKVKETEKNAVNALVNPPKTIAPSIKPKVDGLIITEPNPVKPNRTPEADPFAEDVDPNLLRRPGGNLPGGGGLFPGINPISNVPNVPRINRLAGSPDYVNSVLNPRTPQTYSPNTSADIRKTFDNLVPDKVLSNFEGLTTALNNFPRTVEHNFTGTLNVLLNGAEAFAQMNPQIEQLVMDRITSSMNKMLKQNFKGRAGEFLQEGNKDEK